MLSHERMIVEVVEYRPEWTDEYKKESAKIKEILKDIFVDIHHIGSTSVPGLSAKPVIDMLVVVTDVELVDQYNPLFEGLGYICCGEHGIAKRRFFKKGEVHRTHQIHVFGKESDDEIFRHLAFRDYLIAHPKIAKNYAELKKKLAKQFPRDIYAYCDGKNDFVKKYEEEARKWKNNM